MSNVTVTIDNSYSQIQGLNAAEEKALKSELSYIVGGKSSFFSKYGQKRRSLLDKKGGFPSGLLNRVILWLDSNKISHKINDLRVKP